MRKYMLSLMLLLVTGVTLSTSQSDYDEAKVIADRFRSDATRLNIQVNKWDALNASLTSLRAESDRLEREHNTQADAKQSALNKLNAENDQLTVLTTELENATSVVSEVLPSIQSKQSDIAAATIAQNVADGIHNDANEKVEAENSAKTQAFNAKQTQDIKYRRVLALRDDKLLVKDTLKTTLESKKTILDKMLDDEIERSWGLWKEANKIYLNNQTKENKNYESTTKNYYSAVMYYQASLYPVDLKAAIDNHTKFTAIRKKMQDTEKALSVHKPILDKAQEYYAERLRVYPIREKILRDAIEHCGRIFSSTPLKDCGAYISANTALNKERRIRNAGKVDRDAKLEKFNRLKGLRDSTKTEYDATPEWKRAGSYYMKIYVVMADNLNVLNQRLVNYKRTLRSWLEKYQGLLNNGGAQEELNSLNNNIAYIRGEISKTQVELDKLNAEFAPYSIPPSNAIKFMSNKVSSVSKEFTDISSALNVLNNKLTEDNTLLEQLTREYNAISVNFNRLANLLAILLDKKQKAHRALNAMVVELGDLQAIRSNAVTDKNSAQVNKDAQQTKVDEAKVAYDTAMTNKKNAYINWQAKANKVTEVENDLEDFKLVKGVAIEMEVKAGQAEAKVARLKASLNIVEVNEVKASDGKVVKTTKGVKVALGAIALSVDKDKQQALITEETIKTFTVLDDDLLLDTDYTHTEIYDLIIDTNSESKATAFIELKEVLKENSEFRIFDAVKGWGAFNVDSDNELTSSTEGCTTSNWANELVINANCVSFSIKAEADIKRVNVVVAISYPYQHLTSNANIDIVATKTKSGGGGCVYNPNTPARFDMGFILMIILSAYYLIRRRRLTH